MVTKTYSTTVDGKEVQFEADSEDDDATWQAKALKAANAEHDSLSTGVKKQAEGFVADLATNPYAIVGGTALAIGGLYKLNEGWQARKEKVASQKAFEEQINNPGLHAVLEQQGLSPDDYINLRRSGLDHNQAMSGLEKARREQRAQQEASNPKPEGKASAPLAETPIATPYNPEFAEQLKQRGMEPGGYFTARSEGLPAGQAMAFATPPQAQAGPTPEPSKPPFSQESPTAANIYAKQGVDVPTVDQLISEGIPRSEAVKMATPEKPVAPPAQVETPTPSSPYYPDESRLVEKLGLDVGSFNRLRTEHSLDNAIKILQQEKLLREGNIPNEQVLTEKFNQTNPNPVTSVDEIARKQLQDRGFVGDIDAQAKQLGMKAPFTAEQLEEQRLRKEGYITDEDALAKKMGLTNPAPFTSKDEIARKYLMDLGFLGDINKQAAMLGMTKPPEEAVKAGQEAEAKALSEGKTPAEAKRIGIEMSGKVGLHYTTEAVKEYVNTSWKLTEMLQTIANNPDMNKGDKRAAIKLLQANTIPSLWENIPDPYKAVEPTPRPKKPGPAVITANKGGTGGITELGSGLTPPPAVRQALNQATVRTALSAPGDLVSGFFADTVSNVKQQDEGYKRELEVALLSEKDPERIALLTSELAKLEKGGIAGHAAKRFNAKNPRLEEIRQYLMPGDPWERARNQPTAPPR